MEIELLKKNVRNKKVKKRKEGKEEME